MGLYFSSLDSFLVDLQWRVPGHGRACANFKSGRSTIRLLCPVFFVKDQGRGGAAPVEGVKLEGEMNDLKGRFHVI